MDWPDGCPETIACPVKILCPDDPVTYPESDNVAVVKFKPPSLLIEAMMSVFNVGDATFSWNTTILLVEGTLVEVNADETIVVVVVEAHTAEAVNKT